VENIDKIANMAPICGTQEMLYPRIYWVDDFLGGS